MTKPEGCCDAHEMERPVTDCQCDCCTAARQAKAPEFDAIQAFVVKVTTAKIRREDSDFAQYLAGRDQWTFEPVFCLLPDVINDAHVWAARSQHEFMAVNLDPNTPCFAVWPGKYRSDPFYFPAGQLQSAIEKRRNAFSGPRDAK